MRECTKVRKTAFIAIVQRNISIQVRRCFSFLSPLHKWKQTLKQLLCMHRYRHTLLAGLGSRKQWKEWEWGTVLQLYAQLSWHNGLLPFVFPVFAPSPPVSHPPLQWVWHWLQESIQLSSQAEICMIGFGQVIFLPGWWFQVAWASTKSEAEKPKTNPNKKNQEHVTTGRDGKKLTGNWDLSKTSKQLNVLTSWYWAEPCPAWYYDKRRYRGKSSRLWRETLDAKLLPKLLCLFVLRNEVKHHLWCSRGLEQWRFLSNSL